MDESRFPRQVVFSEKRPWGCPLRKPLDLSLNSFKHKKNIVPIGGVPSPLEPKTWKPLEKKWKNPNRKKERLDKIDLVLQQHYYAVNSIGSFMQELVYLIINSIIINEAIRKEEMKFLDMR